jgi:hypothetical protein
MKSKATIFEKWTGFYLLRLKKKKTVFVTITICLINIELVFSCDFDVTFFEKPYFSDAIRLGKTIICPI